MCHKFNLLVVDDDASMVRLLVRTISNRLGDRFEATGFTDSAAAMSYLDEHCCHVLISDLQMPAVDGLELLRFAKKRNAWTQVIFITAFSTWDRISQAIEHGACDYLLKPMDTKELLLLVDQAYTRLIRWHEAIHGTLSPAAASAE